jgi:dynein heavy chain
VTPKSYLTFLEGYKNIYDVRYNEIKVLTEQISMGLQKLVEAATNVDELKKELKITEKEILIANSKAEEVQTPFPYRTQLHLVKIEDLQVKYHK